MSYEVFLSSKRRSHEAAGLVCDPDKLNPALFPFQRRIVAWALEQGRASLFEECGMGKTLQELAWADAICQRTNGTALILTPLAVALQMQKEAERFGIEARVCRQQSQVRKGINITNYDMLHHFDVASLTAVACDESSIMKAHDSKTRNALLASFSRTPYRLAATATPAPNDHMELGNHSEFMGNLSRAEMLATFFVHDGGDTSKWRLKGHARKPFWQWVCQWAVALTKPSDLGYSDEGYTLPPLTRHHIVVEGNHAEDGWLITPDAKSLDEQRRARRQSLTQRVGAASRLVANDPQPWVVWCDLNDESEALTKAIPNAVEVRGSDPVERKEEVMLAFTSGEIQTLVTKPSIFGWGSNWQHCARNAFVGLSNSFEQMYQAERRFWRFGQKRSVESHIITSEAEGAVLRNIARKQAELQEMQQEMVYAMTNQLEGVTMAEAHGRQMAIPSWLEVA